LLQEKHDKVVAMIKAEDWYETIRMSDDVTLIHEPWITPFYRCNMWHVRGRDRDLLFDSGLGHFSLRAHVPLVTERDLLCVASHTHFDHIGSHHEFPNCCVHHAEAAILENPLNDLILSDRYATDEMFIEPPEGWDSSKYHVKPAQAQRLLSDGDIIDLGNRSFEVIHTPGHSPGGIGLFEVKTGIFLSGDVIYDGPLIDDAYHSDVGDYLKTLERISVLPVSIVHGGHFPSFGKVRFRQVITEYVEGKRAAGCHLSAPTSGV
jgi:glyoxylase-like metal-dependent hydrolase (beta-lactamase superfamily II)